MNNATGIPGAKVLASLTSFPCLDRHGWLHTDPLSRWLIITRAPVLILTIYSCLFAAFYGAGAGYFQFGLWLLAMIALVLAHATNNLLNDYVDFTRKVDEPGYFRVTYGTHVLGHGIVSDTVFKRYLWLTGLAALGLAMLVLALSGQATLFYLLPGAFFLLFYTYPLKQFALGEIAVFLAWGPLMVGGLCHIQAAVFDANSLWLGLVVGLGPTLVILGKHADKLDQDREKNIRTLPVLLGEAATRKLMLAMLISQYIGMTLVVIAGLLPTSTLLFWLSMRAAIRFGKACLQKRPSEPPTQFPDGIWPMWFVAFAFGQMRSFALWAFAGLFMSLLLAGA